MKYSIRLLRLYLPLLLMLVSCQKQELEVMEAEKQPTPEFRETTYTEHGLKVVSQNVGWLTDPIGGYDDHWQDMADWLWENHSDADVIVIQEAFSDEIKDFKDYMNEISNNNFNWTNINKAMNGVFDPGHGIVIMSRSQILDENHYYFQVCNGSPGVCGSDCLAAKGFVSVTLNLGFSQKAYVIGTHLDANDCFLDKFVRYQQLQIIGSHIDGLPTYKHKFPFLIVGDLNIDCRSDENTPVPNTEPGFVDYGSNYKYIKAELNAWASWAGNFITDETHHKPTVRDNKLLDYIMVRSDFLQPINWVESDYHVNYGPIILSNQFTDHANISHEFTFSIEDTKPDPNGCSHPTDCPPWERCVDGECVPI